MNKDIDVILSDHEQVMKFTFRMEIELAINESDLKELGLTQQGLAELFTDRLYRDAPNAVEINTEGDVIFLNTMAIQKIPNRQATL